MKREDFDSVINSLLIMNKRAWAVVMFRYLDQNHDGKIDSSDLFKIYNYLDEILNKN
jgi:Ca2+-binding EF-hand superfamily protein